MEAAAKSRLTALEYLDIEGTALVRSEFLDGEMFAMAGGNRRHSRIKTNVLAAHNRRMRDTPCEVFDSDMKINVTATGLYTYPDASVVCGPPRFENEKEEALLNPKMLFEVLFESTARYDRAQKFWHYRQLDSLSDFMLVAQDDWVVEHHIRQRDGTWSRETVAGPRGMLRLSIGCEIPLAEIYERSGVESHLENET